MIAYAHQGGAWESPSSTVFAVTRALAAGATGIELDVHATADGELVVCHDATVDRTTAATGTIGSLTFPSGSSRDPMSPPTIHPATTPFGAGRQAIHTSASPLCVKCSSDSP